MSKLLEQIALCVENGKINAASPYPHQMKGQAGAAELAKQALEEGITPADILEKALVPAMNIVGQKFSEHKIFVPQMLLSAKAMAAATVHLKPFFSSGEVKRKGVFIMGTVFGDLHDIGKNLCIMMAEGAGWEVIDLGIDIQPARFIEELDKYPKAVVGISALLTTTMVNMEVVVSEIRKKYPSVKIIVGGAPVNYDFARQITADAYGKNPQELVQWLETVV
jgi:5-methyltetrahydrofolate--homocysteine methyltransferase